MEEAEKTLTPAEGSANTLLLRGLKYRVLRPLADTFRHLIKFPE